MPLSKIITPKSTQNNNATEKTNGIPKKLNIKSHNVAHAEHLAASIRMINVLSNYFVNIFSNVTEDTLGKSNDCVYI